MCVFSGRQVSLDLVLRWTYNSVCVCLCVRVHKWVVLCSVAMCGKFQDVLVASQNNSKYEDFLSDHSG